MACCRNVLHNVSTHTALTRPCSWVRHRSVPGGWRPGVCLFSAVVCYAADAVQLLLSRWGLPVTNRDRPRRLQPARQVGCLLCHFPARPVVCNTALVASRFTISTSFLAICVPVRWGSPAYTAERRTRTHTLTRRTHARLHRRTHILRHLIYQSFACEPFLHQNQNLASCLSLPKLCVRARPS